MGRGLYWVGTKVCWHLPCIFPGAYGCNHDFMVQTPCLVLTLPSSAHQSYGQYLYLLIAQKWKTEMRMYMSCFESAAFYFHNEHLWIFLIKAVIHRYTNYTHLAIIYVYTHQNIILYATNMSLLCVHDNF